MLGKDNWIHFENIESKLTDLENIHKNSFIIDYNGNLKYYDDSNILGNIYHNLPSQIFKNIRSESIIDKR